MIFIIADKAKFTINFNSQSDDNHPIGVGSKTSSGNIKFFGQKNQTGSLILNNTGTQLGRGLSAYGDIQIYGGHITVTSAVKMLSGPTIILISMEAMFLQFITGPATMTVSNQNLEISTSTGSIACMQAPTPAT